jgi:hypothetical protein
MYVCDIGNRCDVQHSSTAHMASALCYNEFRMPSSVPWSHYVHADNLQFACEPHPPLPARLPAWLTVNKRADVRFVIKFKFLEHDPIPR